MSCVHTTRFLCLSELVFRPAPTPSISLLDAAEIGAAAGEDVDINANPFNLRPDPSEYVTLMKTLDRKDVSSEIFVRLLDQYQRLHDSEDQPMRFVISFCGISTNVYVPSTGHCCICS